MKPLATGALKGSSPRLTFETESTFGSLLGLYDAEVRRHIEANMLHFKPVSFGYTAYAVARPSWPPSPPRIECAVCNKVVDEVVRYRVDHKAVEVFEVRCHGAVERAELRDEDIRDGKISWGRAFERDPRALPAPR